MNTDQIIPRSVEQVVRDMRDRTTIAVLERDVRELGSRQGPHYAARAYEPRHRAFAHTQGAVRLRRALIAGASVARGPGGGFIGHERACQSIGRELMSVAETIAFFRNVHEHGRRKLYRAIVYAPRQRVTPWFLTTHEARKAWRGKVAPQIESASFDESQIIAVKHHGPGLEYVVDPTVTPSVNWETT